MGRHKKEEIDKKKNISLSINNDVLDKIDNYLKNNKISRSELIEELWKKHIKINEL
jgi:metal-responsive CopG/Arc/MetJ family transcriptional regulator